LFDVRSRFQPRHRPGRQDQPCQKLAELQALFLTEAGKHGALPIDDRFFERLDPARPSAAQT
jgi:hypothetical protein